MIKLMILRWGDCPALSRWVLSEITCILINGGGGRMRFYTQSRRCGNRVEVDWEILALKIRLMWSQVKEWQGHQKLEKARHGFS